jgi:hypothetical protein
MTPPKVAVAVDTSPRPVPDHRSREFPEIGHDLAALAAFKAFEVRAGAISNNA